MRRANESLSVGRIVTAAVVGGGLAFGTGYLTGQRAERVERVNEENAADQLDRYRSTVRELAKISAQTAEVCGRVDVLLRTFRDNPQGQDYALTLRDIGDRHTDLSDRIAGIPLDSSRLEIEHIRADYSQRLSGCIRAMVDAFPAILPGSAEIPAERPNTGSK